MAHSRSRNLPPPMVGGELEWPDISLVIPAHNESGAILPLLREVSQVLESSLEYEVVVVDDASTDGTGEELKAAANFIKHLTVIHHRQRFGQSAGLLSGIRAARAPWIVTLDGDGQNDPQDLPKIWRHHLDHPDVPMICGIRGQRRDSFSKRTASRIANGVRRGILRDGVGDTGCGLKLFERQLFLSFPPFDHMHRFLPALARARGAEIETLDVKHRPRQAGRSKYGILDRLGEGVVDLVGVWWLTRRRLYPKVSQE